MTLRPAALLPLGLALAACGSSDTAPDAAGTGPAMRLEMPSIALAPGQETPQCVTLALSNATPRMLRRIRSTIAAGSHHLIAYRVPADSPLQASPAPCQPFSDIISGAEPVLIAESAEAELAYPAGVALPIAANQKIKLEEHFINVGDATLHSTGSVELELVEPDPSLVEANLLFWGPQQFEIAPHSKGSADLFHLVDPNVHIFALTT